MERLMYDTRELEKIFESTSIELQPFETYMYIKKQDNLQLILVLHYQQFCSISLCNFVEKQEFKIFECKLEWISHIDTIIEQQKNIRFWSKYNNLIAQISFVPTISIQIYNSNNCKI